jgi:hypothetical protein
MVIFYPLWEFLVTYWYSIIGYYNSKPSQYVRGKILEVIDWLRQVTASQWLGFFAIVFFWPIILIIYII